MRGRGMPVQGHKDTARRRETRADVDVAAAVAAPGGRRFERRVMRCGGRSL